MSRWFHEAIVAHGGIVTASDVIPVTVYQMPGGWTLSVSAWILGPNRSKGSYLNSATQSAPWMYRKGKP